MAVYALPWGPKPQFVDSNGDPMNAGTLGTFIAGSTTAQVTYTDSTGGTSNATTITLNSRGEPTNEIWLASGVSYKFVLKDSSGVTIWTVDNVTGVNDTTVTSDEWKAGPTPTYVSATSFTLSGDQTTTFQVGRRVKTTNSGGTVYSTITASTFSVNTTTVVVVNDSSTLDSGLSAVSYGLLSKTNNSSPRGIFPTMANMTGFISGLTYSNNVSDATNDIDIAAGRAVDSTGTDILVLTAITKQLDAAWAVGTNAGGLDTGSIGNSDYYIWLIKRVDTQVVDVLFSLSSTAPTMPSNYTLKRLIGWFKRVGATIVAFHTYETEGGGLEMNWDVPTVDVDLANTLTTARRTDAPKVPLNFSTIAQIRVELFDASTGFTTNICCPDEIDAAPSGSAAPLGILSAASNTVYVFPLRVRTSSAGLIAARATLATVDNYRVVTVGFSWARRN